MIEPVVGVVRNLDKDRGVSIPLTDDLESVLNRDDIDVYVELMGGVDKAFAAVSKVLKKVNLLSLQTKLCLHTTVPLESLAKEGSFGFEASVANLNSIIKVLKGLSANHIKKIVGIFKWH